MPKKKNDSYIQKTFKFPPVLAEKLEWLAEKNQTTEADIIRNVLGNYIDDAIRKFVESAEAIERYNKKGKG